MRGGAMASVNVYRHDMPIDSKQFDVQFMIIKDLDANLFWETYQERQHSRRGGNVEIWVQMGALPEPRISYVAPPWQLIVDEQPLPQVLHSDVAVRGRRIVLEYEDYRFEFSFDDNSDNSGSE
jgi:hypothetical protein